MQSSQRKSWNKPRKIYPKKRRMENQKWKESGKPVHSLSRKLRTNYLYPWSSMRLQN